MTQERKGNTEWCQVMQRGGTNVDLTLDRPAAVKLTRRDLHILPLPKMYSPVTVALWERKKQKKPFEKRTPEMSEVPATILPLNPGIPAFQEGLSLKRIGGNI